MPKRKTQEEFIQEATIKHNGKYSYGNVVYKNNNTKVLITCSTHGDYLQVPSSHLLGFGCKYCSGKNQKDNDQFIREATIKHNGKYSYEKVDYKNNSTKIIISCHTHGDFSQKPLTHLQGRGCPECFKRTTTTFIEAASEVHNGYYIYDKVNYISNKDKVTITCPSHGDFQQQPSNHLNGSGCVKCSIYGYNTNKNGYLYIQTIDNGCELLGYKIGITNITPEKRLKQIQSVSELNHDLLWSFKMNGEFIRKLESTIHSNLEHVDLSGLMRDGFTEVITPDSIDEAFRIIRTSILKGFN